MNQSSSRHHAVLAFCLTVAGVVPTWSAAAPPGQSSSAPSSRFVLVEHSRQAASRVAREGDRLVVASGTELRVVPLSAAGDPEPTSSLATPLLEPAHQVALIGSRCFVIGASGALALVDLDGPPALPREVALDLRPGVLPHLAAMDDHLILAVEGRGISIIPANPAHQHGAGPHLDRPLITASEVSLDSGFVAVAASARFIYAATGSGEILMIDARRPLQPELVRRFPSPAGVSALAANGSHLYTLGADGLKVLDVEEEPPLLLAHAPAIHGESLSLVGRELHVASPENTLKTYLDTSALPQLIRVTVANNFFSPRDIVLQVGDTVRWTNVSGFHNVRSCLDSSFGCEQGPANEVFTSGLAGPPPWVYTYTFAEPGFNPYKCVPHAPFMVGTVTVNAPRPPPLTAAVDIKPGSCTNPVNVRSRGVLPVAILGSPDLDVTTIEPGSVELAGVGPLRWSLEDVGGPAASSAAPPACQDGCDQPGPDGRLDLTLKFDTARILEALGEIDDRQCSLVELTGRLNESLAHRDIVGGDVLFILRRGRRP